MILGILGGMGPAATCDFFRKIIDCTDAKSDKEHLHIVIDNNTQIPDRTDFICGFGEDPRVEMIRSALKLEAMGADYIAMPCNTAHYFYDDIKKYTKAKMIHMIRETAVYLKNNDGGCKGYLLLATDGTYRAGIYKEIFNRFNLKLIEPEDSDRQTVMGWIYGVKSSKYDVSANKFVNLVNKYGSENDISLILGCTELPLLAEAIGVSRQYIDPVSILAKRCVDIALGHINRGVMP